MIRALIAKAWGDTKLLLAAFVALWFFFPWLNIWVSSMINIPAFSEFLANALPKQWERISGTSFSQLATTVGRVAVIFVHPLLVFGAPIWAVTRGSDCVSGQIERGTMEMLLAQPVRRTTLFATHALVTILASAILAGAAWCGVAVGLATVTLPEHVSATLFIPPTVNLFGLLVCVGGMTALMSSWDGQRWRTAGLMGAWCAFSVLLTLASRIGDKWQWLDYFSFFHAYNPQSMVAHPDAAWAIWEYKDGIATGLGLGGHQLVLFSIGLLCYIAGAVIFSRREIPAPL